jgi:hypothetical protein
VLVKNAVRKVASGESLRSVRDERRDLKVLDQSQWCVVMSRGKRERFSCCDSFGG